MRFRIAWHNTKRGRCYNSDMYTNLIIENLEIKAIKFDFTMTVHVVIDMFCFIFSNNSILWGN